MTENTLLQDWPRHLPAFLVLAGAGPLAIAYYAQFFQAAEPCILCLYQRVPFALITVAGLVAWFRPTLAPLMGMLAGVLFLSGMGIAIYHVGVEQHWWVSSCTGALPTEMSIADFQKQLLVPEKACDDIDWTLFGVSMATYNVAYSLMLALISFTGAVKLKRG